MTGCATPIEVAGPGLAPSILARPEIAVTISPDSRAALEHATRSAVEHALAARGIGARAEAPYRVDAAFAVAPVGLRVTSGGSPVDPARGSVALCKRQQYVLSLAILNRSDGRVLFRNRPPRCAAARRRPRCCRP